MYFFLKCGTFPNYVLPISPMCPYPWSNYFCRTRYYVSFFFFFLIPHTVSASLVHVLGAVISRPSERAGQEGLYSHCLAIRSIWFSNCKTPNIPTFYFPFYICLQTHEFFLELNFYERSKQKQEIKSTRYHFPTTSPGALGGRVVCLWVRMVGVLPHVRPSFVNFSEYNICNITVPFIQQLGQCLISHLMQHPTSRCLFCIRGDCRSKQTSNILYTSLQ